MFALHMEPYGTIRVSVLLQAQVNVVANWVIGNFGATPGSHSRDQGPSLLKTLGGTNLYRLRFDDVIMFIQP